MGYLNSDYVIGPGALLVGILLIAWGLYLRRHGRLRNRQGAAVLAGFVAVMGVVALGVGAIVISRGAWD